MLTVLGKEIDFDVTSPADMQRYLDAEAAMQRAAASLPPDPNPAAMATMEGLRAYQDYLAAQCKLLTDFIDTAFGDGTCNALLGPKTSLSTLLDVWRPCTTPSPARVHSTPSGLPPTSPIAPPGARRQNELPVVGGWSARDH